jgi:hypothetical protein
VESVDLDFQKGESEKQSRYKIFSGKSSRKACGGLDSKACAVVGFFVPGVCCPVRARLSLH